MTIKEHRETCVFTPYKDTDKLIGTAAAGACRHCLDYNRAMTRAVNGRDLSTVSIGGLRELKKILQQINAHYWGQR